MDNYNSIVIKSIGRKMSIDFKFNINISPPFQERRLS